MADQLAVVGYTDLLALAMNLEDGYPYEYLTPAPTTKRCTALTPHAPAQAQLDALREEVARLTKERDELNDARNGAIERCNFMFSATRDAQEIAALANDRWAKAQTEIDTLRTALAARKEEL